MKDTALITGASSGIGKEFARIHAKRGGDLVITARSEDALQELKQELESQHGVKVIVIAEDLGRADVPQKIYDALKSAGVEVDYLINNAGFGGHGKFIERDWREDEAMIDLNIKSLARLTRLFLPDMVSRNRGKVLNVASTAAFIPGPLQAVYYATKAFVLSFSEAINEEVSDTNVTVTALCPGAVDTGFAKAGHLEHLEAFQSKNAATAASVAQCGYDAMLAGKPVVINEFGLRVMLKCVLPLLPRRLVAKLSRRFMEK